jgi:mycothiol synthase
MSVWLRAPRLDETAAIAELANRVSDELFGEAEETETTVRQWLTTPDLELDEDFRVALDDEERLIGYADLGAHPDPKYWLDLRAPMSASDETRDALIRWGDERARTRAAGQDGALIRGFAYEQDARVRAALERHGYELIRHSYRMRIDFDDDPPQPEWPGGVTVRPATEADLETAYETQMETFEDSWEHSREPYEEWSHWMAEEDLDLSLWFVAEEEDEVAGIALTKPHEAEDGLGWVRVLGVRRPWRRRGLGRALLLHTFQEYLSRGFHGVGLGVDAGSLTGAVRLYENAGMRVFRRSDIYEKVLGR